MPRIPPVSPYSPAPPGRRPCQNVVFSDATAPLAAGRTLIRGAAKIWEQAAVFSTDRWEAIQRRLPSSLWYHKLCRRFCSSFLPPYVKKTLRLKGSGFMVLQRQHLNVKGAIKYLPTLIGWSNWWLPYQTDRNELYMNVLNNIERWTGNAKLLKY